MTYILSFLLLCSSAHLISGEVQKEEELFEKLHQSLEPFNGSLFINEAELSKRFKEYFDGLFKPVNIPYLPLVLNINPDAVDASLSLSLSNLTISGFSNVGISSAQEPSTRFRVKVLHFNFRSLKLDASKYAAGGHIMNFPFAGKSKLRIEGKNLLVKLFVNLKFKLLSLKFCMNSGFDTSIQVLKVDFDNLNPGTGTGITVNSFLSQFGPELVPSIGEQLNEILAPKLDDIIKAYFKWQCDVYPLFQPTCDLFTNNVICRL